MTIDIIEQAREIVEQQLALIEVSVESRRALRSGKYTCQCASCRYARERASQWLERIRGDEPVPSGAVAAVEAGGFDADIE